MYNKAIVEFSEKKYLTGLNLVNLICGIIHEKFQRMDTKIIISNYKLYFFVYFY